MPNWILQTKIDTLCSHIQTRFSGLKRFNSWLQSNGHGSWSQQLAISLAKLPLRAAFNVINTLYKIIKRILYSAVHPLKSLTLLAKDIVHLLEALTHPETWTKIGSGMIGVGLGQALILAEPVSVIAVAIGAALLIAGVSFGALKAAIDAEKGSKMIAASNNTKEQLLFIPESMLTGFFMGILLGGIRRLISPKEPAETTQYQRGQVASTEQAFIKARAFIDRNGLPDYEQIWIKPDGSIHMSFKTSWFETKFPGLIGKQGCISRFEVVLNHPTWNDHFFIDYYNPGFNEHTYSMLDISNYNLN